MVLCKGFKRNRQDYAQSGVSVLEKFKDGQRNCFVCSSKSGNDITLQCDSIPPNALIG